MKYIRIFFISLLVLLVTGICVGYILFRKGNTELYVMDGSARKNVSGNFIQLSDGVTHYELAGEIQASSLC